MLIAQTGIGLSGSIHLGLIFVITFVESGTDSFQAVDEFFSTFRKLLIGFKIPSSSFGNCDGRGKLRDYNN